MKIEEVKYRSSKLSDQLLSVWERSVKQTHSFLSESEFLRVKEYVPSAIDNVQHLIIAMDGDSLPLAFLGINGHKIEMLFVDASDIGRGIGKQLLTFAIEHYDVNEVTVNEQNPQAIGFYEHMGFTVFKRTDKDEEGGDYPLLYMKLRKYASIHIHRKRQVLIDRETKASVG